MTNHQYHPSISYHFFPLEGRGGTTSHFPGFFGPEARYTLGDVIAKPSLIHVFGQCVEEEVPGEKRCRLGTRRTCKPWKTLAPFFFFLLLLLWSLVLLLLTDSQSHMASDMRTSERVPLFILFHWTSGHLPMVLSSSKSPTETLIHLSQCVLCPQGAVL